MVARTLTKREVQYAERIAKSDLYHGVGIFKGYSAKEKLDATTCLIQACEDYKKKDLAKASANLQGLSKAVKDALVQKSIFRNHLGDLYHQFKEITKIDPVLFQKQEALVKDYWRGSCP